MDSLAGVAKAQYGGISGGGIPGNGGFRHPEANIAVPVERDRGHIQIAVERHSEIVALLMKRVEELPIKLQPVLRNVPTAAANQHEKPGNATPLAAYLDDRSEDLCSVLAKIQDIHNRLEL